LAPLGITPKYFNTEIFLTDGEKKDASALLASLGADHTKKYVAIHPGATWANKMWLKENFAALIQRLVAETDATILLSPGPTDAELMKYLQQDFNDRVITLPLLPVRTLAAVLSRCTVFVSNDCGPMHIGVAVGAKTIGIFGPEPIEIWFPYDKTKGHIPLFKKISCSPCRTTSCFREPGGYLECMRLITVDEIFSLVTERLR
jgi:heptosyltransferase-2